MKYVLLALGLIFLPSLHDYAQTAASEQARISQAQVKCFLSNRYFLWLHSHSYPTYVMSYIIKVYTPVCSHHTLGNAIISIYKVYK